MDAQASTTTEAAGSATTMCQAGVLSRSTVQAAMELLQQRHAIADPDTAFTVLRDVSQRHNVKLRTVAAAVLESPTQLRRPVPPPSLSFSARGQSAQPNRTDVLHDLMRAAMQHAGTAHGTVQTRDPLHGGLRIDGHRGFDCHFIDFFSYVHDSSTSCGTALTESRQVLVDDVDGSPVFAQPDRDELLAAGIRSVLSTPLLDECETVRGMVSTHHLLPQHLPSDLLTHNVQRLANECARWLAWYDATVMPAVVASVHEEAAHAAHLSCRRVK